MPIQDLLIIQMKPHLRDKHEAERSGSAEDDKEGDDDEGGRLLLVQHEGHGHAQDTHDRHVVDGHAHVLGVVQGRDLDLTGLPRQEGSEEL